MREKDRKSGIDIVGDIPWGTHFCQFYQTRGDLIDILVPYFKAGLENNESCLWITSKPLEVEEAKVALKKAVGNLSKYIRKGQIKLLDYREWYTRSGRFEGDEVLQAWAEEENQALGRGFNGLRAAGNMSWHKKRDWSDLRNYEKSVEDVINSHRMIGLCSYCLDKLEAAEVIDVVQNHQLALTEREGKQETINNVERRQLKAIEERRKHVLFSPRRMLTVGQAAQFLGLHPNTVRRWSQIGILKCSQIGTRGHRRFLQKDLERFLEMD